MDTSASITRLVLPGLTNRYGGLFGGVALSLMDEAAGIVSTRVARGPVVTAHIESVDFKAPIWQGQAVRVEAELSSIGNTSMRIKVRTYGECLEEGTDRLTTEAEFVMVAIDKEGRPRPVPRAGSDADEASSNEE